MKKCINKKQTHITFFTTLGFKNTEVNKLFKIKVDLKEKVFILLLINRDSLAKRLVIKKNKLK